MIHETSLVEVLINSNYRFGGEAMLELGYALRARAKALGIEASPMTLRIVSNFSLCGDGSELQKCSVLDVQDTLNTHRLNPATATEPSTDIVAQMVLIEVGLPRGFSWSDALHCVNSMIATVTQHSSFKWQSRVVATFMNPGERKEPNCRGYRQEE